MHTAENEAPAIPDAYAEHVAKLRERMAQDPVDELFDVSLSEDAIKFLGAALELVRPTTDKMADAKYEVERALLNAVRERIRENDKVRDLPPAGEVS